MGAGGKVTVSVEGREHFGADDVRSTEARPLVRKMGASRRQLRRRERRRRSTNGHGGGALCKIAQGVCAHTTLENQI